MNHEIIQIIMNVLNAVNNIPFSLLLNLNQRLFSQTIHSRKQQEMAKGHKWIRLKYGRETDLRNGYGDKM